MELKQAMQERRSIRGFKKDPVPRALLEEVIALANRAPSSMNTQPWHLHVLTGEPLEKVREGNSTRMLQGVPPVREISDHGAYGGVHRDRQVGIAKQLFAAMGIERDDKERRQDWVMRGFRQFDAPVSIVVCFDKSLDDNGTIAHFDLGAVTYGLVLAAWSKGLGCVINGQGIMQSPVVREHAQIPDDQVIMTCVAMGWPDEDFSANAVVSTRRPVEEVTRFVGFDE
ncbi:MULTISPECIES: nitroreductase [unclassified Sulfitobacter]|uniref:nitroreductase n=1 Tax=Sulfitobacter TaxID=60136 RepID=UPI000066B1B5|nr:MULTISPECIES: nitroreductase [unclassified Sulfitobacter]AXI50746.1 nitroreductase [Sulfitobacter sp. SK025]EAP80355.1 putative nitroreductase [Sulfitobacter sp. NAS-14.1]